MPIDLAVDTVVVGVSTRASRLFLPLPVFFIAAQSSLPVPPSFHFENDGVLTNLSVLILKQAKNCKSEREVHIMVENVADWAALVILHLRGGKIIGSKISLDIVQGRIGREARTIRALVAARPVAVPIVGLRGWRCGWFRGTSERELV